MRRLYLRVRLHVPPPNFKMPFFLFSEYYFSDDNLQGDFFLRRQVCTWFESVVYWPLVCNVILFCPLVRHHVFTTTVLNRMIISDG